MNKLFYIKLGDSILAKKKKEEVFINTDFELDLRLNEILFFENKKVAEKVRAKYKEAILQEISLEEYYEICQMEISELNDEYKKKINNYKISSIIVFLMSIFCLYLLFQ